MSTPKRIKQYTALTASVFALGALFTHLAFADPLSALDIPSSANTAVAVKSLEDQNPNLDPKVLKLAINAYQVARCKGLDEKGILTIINYAKASNEKRLWVIDLKDNKILYNALVAHGKNSGENHATQFSNRANSDESSLGVFVTANTYGGKHGTSLRLKGLEPGFNDNALQRDVVMHSAWYVSPKIAKEQGRIGRSWGCLALSQQMEPKVVNVIKNGTIIFAYYPENQWLKSSAFLKQPSNPGAKV